MDLQNARHPPIVVLTSDPELLDHVLSITAVVGVEPHVVHDAGELRPLWAAAAMVLVGVDRVTQVAGLVLPPKTGVYLLGKEDARDEVHQWSVPLGAAVVTLPDGASWLATAVADAASQRSGSGRLLCVIGGCGGVGASTLAAGLAVVAARSQQQSMLIDADPPGGGLALLLGAERSEGWRWPRLATARGHLGDLRGHLPSAAGVDLLSMARGDTTTTSELRAEQMGAVLASAVRSHRLTVVDLPRSLAAAGREALRRADLVLLLAQADVRGVAAAGEMCRELDGTGPAVGVLARIGRVRGLDGAAVAAGLGRPLWGSVADDPGLPMAAERGDPPARSARSPLARTCRSVLDRLSSQAVAA